MSTTPLRPRDAGRRATERRLLDAALTVFLARGYDAATTGEMAREAGVAAGTFYCHFRDKRAAFEALAHRAAHDLLHTWRAALRPDMSAAAAVETGLHLTAAFWRATPAVTRLLLEGGPSLGSLGHLRLVDEIAKTLADHATGRTTPRALALLLAGVAIETGRVVAASPERTTDVDDLVRLAAAMLGADAGAPPASRGDAREPPAGEPPRGMRRSRSASRR